MTTTLKPCPFCNGRAVASTRGNGFGYGESYVLAFVKCVECGAEISAGGYAEQENDKRIIEVITAWNRRA